MAGKGSRKLHHSTEEDRSAGEERPGERVEDMKSVVEMFLDNQHRKDEENRDYRAEAERREEARQIAAENRAEARRQADKIAEEERAEARAEAKAKRRREEARMAEEAERAREEAARLASERLREQQEAAGIRAYEQQVALIRMQVEIGERAAEAQRHEAVASRKRDRAVAGIPNYRDPEDVEDFLLTSERKLKAGEVPEREWLAIVAAKLSGKVGSTWQDLCMTGGDYQDVKSGLLRVCGYTPKLAGEVFYGFKTDSLRGMSADQVYHRGGGGGGVQLLRRMVAPLKMSAEMEFAMLKPWVWSIVARKARLILDARVVSTSGELIGALQDYLVTEGERTEGQAAVFRKQAQGAERESEGKKGTSITCFKCGKVGHKAVDCWQKGGSAPSSSYKAASVPAVPYSKVICYNCGEEGHKSTSCPKEKKVNPKEGVAKAVRQLWLRDSTDTVLEGVVNGKKASILLDSGASISIVPEVMVGKDLKTGESVLVRPFQSKTPMKLPTARVVFSVDNLEWEELVALAPVEKGRETEVLYGLDLKMVKCLGKKQNLGLELLDTTQIKSEFSPFSGGGNIAFFYADKSAVIQTRLDPNSPTDDDEAKFSFSCELQLIERSCDDVTQQLLANMIVVAAMSLEKMCRNKMDKVRTMKHLSTYGLTMDLNLPLQLYKLTINFDKSSVDVHHQSERGLDLGTSGLCQHKFWHILFIMA